MNIKKIAAGILAASIGTVALAASASANTATLKFADGSWSINSMGDQDLLEESSLVDTEVTKDGTYTVSYGEVLFQDGDENYGVAEGTTVFCVDILGLAKDKGVGAGSEAYDALAKDATAKDKMQVAKDGGINVSDVKVTITDPDGKTTDVSVDQSKILFGDIEGNGNLRIEIYNEYGDTKKDSPINTADITNAVTVAVTFTISGLDAEAPATSAAGDATEAPTTSAAGDTNQPTTDKNSPDTGVEGVAVVAGLAVIAAGAVVVAKKRK